MAKKESSMGRLIERSSLGTPAARAIRSRTPTGIVANIVHRSTALPKPAQSHSATNQRVTSIQALAKGVDQKRSPQKKGKHMAKENNRHVVPNPEGGWDVRKPDADRASSHQDTQADAIDRAREIVHNAGGGEVVIHGRDGRIRDSDTIAPGNDPNPPRDTK